MTVTDKPEDWREAVKASLPVMFGYLPLGIAFGVLFSELGYHWIWAMIMGVVIYAGAAQFLAVGLLANQAGLAEVFVSTFLLNARHLFYGISMVRTMPKRGWQRWYLIFGLTDETYSLLTSRHPPEGVDPIQFKFWITLFNQSYWVLGCAIGGWLGQQLPFSTEGIEFSLPALFLVLTLEQYFHLRQLRPFLLALLIGVACWWLFDQGEMLTASIGLAVSLLVGAQRWKWNLQ